MTFRHYSALLALLAFAGCGSDPEPQPEPQPNADQPRATTHTPARHMDEDPIEEGRLLLATSGEGRAAHEVAHRVRDAARAAGHQVSIASNGQSDITPLYLVAWGHAQ
jgi:hypothetical protein